MAYAEKTVDGIVIKWLDSRYKKQLTIESKARLCEHLHTLGEWDGNVNRLSDRILFMMEVGKVMGYRNCKQFAKGFITRYYSPYIVNPNIYNELETIAVARKPIKTVTITISDKIKETNNTIQKLLEEVEKLKGDLSVLQQAKELMEVE